MSPDPFIPSKTFSLQGLLYDMQHGPLCYLRFLGNQVLKFQI